VAALPFSLSQVALSKVLKTTFQGCHAWQP
jgi:hypothetical protein